MFHILVYLVTELSTKITEVSDLHSHQILEEKISFPSSNKLEIKSSILVIELENGVRN